MAQTSTTLLASKSHIANVTGTDITFTASGTEYKITSTSTALNGFAVRDLITVEASAPEILTIATPETPGPEDSAYIVINLLYPELFYWI